MESNDDENANFHEFLPTNFRESLFSRIYWNFSKLDMTRPYIQEKSFNFGACDVDYSINTFYFILCRSRKSCPFAYGWRLKVELSWQSHRRPSPSGLNFWDLAVTLTRSWRTLAQPETKKQSNIIHQLIP